MFAIVFRDCAAAMKVLYGWKAVVHTYRIPQIIPYAAIPQLFAELLGKKRTAEGVGPFFCIISL